MAIRLRKVDGVLVALCAARSIEKPGDVYLHDGQHHALSVKFDLDHASMAEAGCPPGVYIGTPEARLIEQEESNNPARAWWDRTYGKGAT